MRKHSNKIIKKLITVLFTVVIPVSAAFYGCSDDSSAPPVTTAVKPVIKGAVIAPAVPPVEAVPEIKESQAGYVYDRRGRRDPFSSLIIPSAKSSKDDSKMGTLEGYDLSEFVLLAIAIKGEQFYALLTTPDNRSFTVNRGDTVGLNNGKVMEITRDMVALVEHTVNYKGEKLPRQIILEFHKGE
ncbi:MAG: pilus assembly protein PilP [Nitrospirota bacterium]